MFEMRIVGNETGADVVRQLVALRLLARRTIRLTNKTRAALELARARPDAAATVAELAELELNLRFDKIAIGRYLVHLCAALDQKAEPAAIFEAINTNVAHRDSEDVRKYGTKASVLICVLRLEDSATKDDSIDVQPLNWCYTLAFMNELQSNSAFDRIVHDGANEHFGGAFGEFRDRPLTERLIGRAV